MNESLGVVVVVMHAFEDAEKVLLLCLSVSSVGGRSIAAPCVIGFALPVLDCAYLDLES